MLRPPRPIVTLGQRLARPRMHGVFVDGVLVGIGVARHNEDTKDPGCDAFAAELRRRPALARELAASQRDDAPRWCGEPW